MKALLATVVTFASASMALAQTKPVPEISALEGTAALAAVAAIVLFTWERSRRAQ